MKQNFAVVFIILLFSSHFSYSFEDLRLQPEPYTVNKDSADKSIAAGYFVLSGRVIGFSSNLPIDNVLVGCLSSGIWVRTDKGGNFTVTLKSTDEVVYFYKEGWSEVVIEDYDFKEQHVIEMTIYLSQPQIPQTVRKPVIYMYSNTDLNANVELIPRGSFTFTYPKYHDGWNVVVKSEGGVQVNGRYYPYLFWEGEADNLGFRTKEGKLSGFIIESQDVVSFLEDKLGQLGLNQNEQTDFITYWGPLLSNKKYALIQFMVDDQCASEIAQLKISPEPDNIRRVYMLCSGLDDNNVGFEVVPQNLTSFERNGFTVVEWGGTLLDIQNITP